MTSAGGYILRVPMDRRDVLLNEEGFSRYTNEPLPAGEPVPKFQHDRSVSLVVFACFADGAITHIADGRKGTGAGRGLVVLNLHELEALRRPLTFKELRKQAPARIRRYIDDALSSGGKLSPKSLASIVDLVLARQPDLSGRLGRFSQRRSEIIARIPLRSRNNLALQKEALAVALAISGMDTEPILRWTPEGGQPKSFLDGLQSASVREDAAIVADLSSIPGFAAVKEFPFATKVFRSPMKPGVQLTVILANKLKLEEQTGADLIYYNETYRSFVLVQYKTMSKGAKGAEFRWKAGDQLAIEIKGWTNF